MQQNFSQYFRALQILFFALLFGQAGIIGVLYFFHDHSQNAVVPDLHMITQVLPVLLAALLGLAFFLNRKKMETARAQTDLREKLGGYRIASVLKWALIEGGTLINAVLFLLSGKMLFVYFALAMIAILATQFPSRQRLINDLDLSVNEQMMLDDPNVIVY